MSSWYDSEPRIRTTDLRIRHRIRIRILLFSPVADKMPTKNKFLFFFAYYVPYFLKLHIDISLQKIKDKKFKNSRKVFFTFFACWRKDPDPYKKLVTGPDLRTLVMHILEGIGTGTV